MILESPTLSAFSLMTMSVSDFSLCVCERETERERRSGRERKKERENEMGEGKGRKWGSTSIKSAFSFQLQKCLAGFLSRVI